MPELKRTLSLFNVTIAGVGIILGAGIYALIGLAATYSGNATWLSFLITAVIAIFTGLTYAELTTMFKGDAGEYDYLSSGYNKKFALFISIAILFIGVVSSATVALGFGGYVSNLIPVSLVVGALILVVLMSLINFKGIDDSSRFNTISTLIELAGLVIIIFLGITKFGSVNYFEMPLGFSGVLSSAALVFFAYMGFETIVKLREETINPEKTIPKAIVLSIIITSILYVLVAISAVSLIGWEELSKSEAPLAMAAAAVLGSPAFILIAIIALFSTANTVLITLVTTSRMLYGVAKEKALPKVFSKVHKKNRTPHVAIFTLMFLTLIFVLIGDIELVANLTNLFLFFVFAVVNLGLIILRYKNKSKRKFRVPLNIGRFPVLSFIGFLTSTIMMYFVLRNIF